jgi:hypothetical protein
MKRMKRSDVRKIASDIASKLDISNNFFDGIQHLLLNEEGPL